MDFREVSNLPGLWVAGSLAIIVVVIQAIIYVQKAYKAGLKMGFTNSQLNAALRAGAIAAVGPAFAVAVGLIALMAIVGGPLAWQRLSVVGSLMYEVFAISLGTGALGTGELTVPSFVALAWALPLSAAIWQTNVALLTDKYDMLLEKASKGDPQRLAIISGAAMTGLLSKFLVEQFWTPGPGLVAMITAIVVMFILRTLAQKYKLNWFLEWCLPIAMFSGMFATLLM